MTETQIEVVAGDALASDTVEVTAFLPHGIDRVWHVLTTNEGAEAFLGAGATLGSKGEHWRASDGTHGVWRSYHPAEQVRVSWHADEDSPRSLVDLHLRAEGTGTVLSLRHEQIAVDCGDLTQRWSEALRRIEAAAR